MKAHAGTTTSKEKLDLPILMKERGSLAVILFITSTEGIQLTGTKGQSICRPHYDIDTPYDREDVWEPYSKSIILRNT